MQQFQPNIEAQFMDDNIHKYYLTALQEQKIVPVNQAGINLFFCTLNILFLNLGRLKSGSTSNFAVNEKCSPIWKFTSLISAWTEYFASGEKKSVESYESGLPNGEWADYYANSNSKQESNWEAGVLNGSWTEWYLNKTNYSL